MMARDDGKEDDHKTTSADDNNNKNSRCLFIASNYLPDIARQFKERTSSSPGGSQPLAIELECCVCMEAKIFLPSPSDTTIPHLPTPGVGGLEEAVLFPGCGHIVGVHCAAAWMDSLTERSRWTCPYCRAPVCPPRCAEHSDATGALFGLRHSRGVQDTLESAMETMRQFGDCEDCELEAWESEQEDVSSTRFRHQVILDLLYGILWQLRYEGAEGRREDDKRREFYREFGPEIVIILLYNQLSKRRNGVRRRLGSPNEEATDEARTVVELMAQPEREIALETIDRQMRAAVAMAGGTKILDAYLRLLRQCLRAKVRAQEAEVQS